MCVGGNDCGLSTSAARNERTTLCYGRQKQVFVDVGKKTELGRKKAVFGKYDNALVRTKNGLSLRKQQKPKKHSDIKPALTWKNCTEN